ncbi:MAG: EAL domain-containing protein [Eubacteriales bacterium]|nr:EAL domain-containing protein [Eubacteriales bacterium]
MELQDRVEEFMEQDLFTLVIQPVMDYRANTTYNGEVLSRLEHPERGVIFPDRFLAAIDAKGLYPRFDRYIFRKCCAWLSRSLAAGERMDCISCNFSRKTLSEVDLVQDLTQSADHYGLPHNMLALEITEHEQETDAGQMIDNLKQLKAAGFRIILDDYGTGVTSEKDLTQYPLDIVKIDSSLLLNACTEQNAAALRALVATAKRLGNEVVCEGIETKEQDAFVRDIGCDYGQGYLYFKPIRQDDVFEMMRRSSILGAEE